MKLYDFPHGGAKLIAYVSVVFNTTTLPQYCYVAATIKYAMV